MLIRKLLLSLFWVFISFSARADLQPAVNVEYIHKLVEQEHGIQLAYGDDAASTPNRVANMEYLLKVVDLVNAHLNGADKATSYATDAKYATKQVADTVAAIYVIRNLIEHYYFTATTTADTTSFSFSIAAKGVFHIDWGDGNRESVEKTTTNVKTFSHNYSQAGVYKVKIGGYSTDYSNDKGCILFTGNKNIAAIAGSLGRLFPTLRGNLKPIFYETFRDCSNIASTIPEELFAGVHGTPINRMFELTFYNCSALTGVIPAGLFSGIYGAPKYNMFRWTFAECRSLSGIGGPLFGRIYGKPAINMFNNVFYGCAGLTGPIPPDLFGGVPEANGLMLRGEPASGMFSGAFHYCSGLTGIIPPEIFGDIYGDPASSMFNCVFSGCSKLGTGIADTDIPQYMKDGYAFPPNLFAKIKGAPQKSMFSMTFQDCSGLTGKIPEYAFGDIYGEYAPNMFTSVFAGCRGLVGTIPPDLFGGVPNADGSVLGGIPATDMFSYVFQDCTGLTGAIPSEIFGQIDGEPANRMFRGAFYKCSGLGTEIADADMPQYMKDGYAFPPDLFGGLNLSGGYKVDMFSDTFYGCTGLSGEIPEYLFGDLYGTPQKSMFSRTFYECAGLNKEIPATLFGGERLSGTPAAAMFESTFYGCSGLTEIPRFLFGKLSGAPAPYMFYRTFDGCEGLKGVIPSDLFGEISGDLPLYDPNNRLNTGNSFVMTFHYCTGLTGESPKIGGKYLYEIWTNPSEKQVNAMYYACRNLTDYNNMPTIWK